MNSYSDSIHKKYPIDSIDKKLCKYTDLSLLELLDTCSQCNKIPLPSYKSKQNPKYIYCRNCYNQKNYDPKNLKEPSKKVEFLLEKLVISCKYEEIGCKEKYQIDSLQNLLDHELLCSNNLSLKPVFKENEISL